MELLFKHNTDLLGFASDKHVFIMNRQSGEAVIIHKEDFLRIAKELENGI